MRGSDLHGEMEMLRMKKIKAKGLRLRLNLGDWWVCLRLKGMYRGREKGFEKQDRECYIFNGRYYIAIHFSDFRSTLGAEEFVLVWGSWHNIHGFHRQAIPTIHTLTHTPAATAGPSPTPLASSIFHGMSPCWLTQGHASQAPSPTKALAVCWGSRLPISTVVETITFSLSSQESNKWDKEEHRENLRWPP